MDWINQFRVQLKKNKTLAYGLPFMTVVVLGPFVLKKFGEMRYKYRKVTQVSEKEMEEMGMKMKKNENEISLEEEYEKVKEMDIENWEQVRGPRPWEEGFVPQKDQSKST